MRHTLFIALWSFLIAPLSFAQQLDETQLRVRGGVITNESRSEALFLACADETETCEKVHYVIYDQSKRYLVLSKTFQIKSDDDLKQHLKSVFQAITTGSNLYLEKGIPYNPLQAPVLESLKILKTQDGYNWSSEYRTLNKALFLRLKHLLILARAEDFQTCHYRVNRRLLFNALSRLDTEYRDGNWYIVSPAEKSK